jgi:hypothetical protein
MNATPTLAPDAAMVLGIASTAMPFARTRDAQAERWLRLLRLHGEVGIALQGLGVSEMPLPAPGEAEPPEGAFEFRDEFERDELEGDAVQAVTSETVRIAIARGASGVATTDVLMAVIEVYGEDFDRVLRAHGTDRDEVLERLGLEPQAAAGA